MVISATILCVDSMHRETRFARECVILAGGLSFGTVSNGGVCNNSRVDSSRPRTPQVIYAHASDSRVCGRRSQDGNAPSFGRWRVPWYCGPLAVHTRVSWT